MDFPLYSLRNTAITRTRTMSQEVILTQFIKRVNPYLTPGLFIQTIAENMLFQIRQALQNIVIRLTEIV